MAVLRLDAIDPEEEEEEEEGVEEVQEAAPGSKQPGGQAAPRPEGAAPLGMDGVLSAPPCNGTRPQPRGGFPGNSGRG